VQEDAEHPASSPFIVDDPAGAIRAVADVPSDFLNKIIVFVVNDDGLTAF